MTRGPSLWPSLHGEHRHRRCRARRRHLTKQSGAGLAEKGEGARGGAREHALLEGAREQGLCVLAAMAPKHDEVGG